jgi:hypothetical protein
MFVRGLWTASLRFDDIGQGSPARVLVFYKCINALGSKDHIHQQCPSHKTPHSYEIRGLLKMNHHHAMPLLDIRTGAAMIVSWIHWQCTDIFANCQRYISIFIKSITQLIYI